MTKSYKHNIKTMGLFFSSFGFLNKKQLSEGNCGIFFSVNFLHLEKAFLLKISIFMSSHSRKQFLQLREECFKIVSEHPGILDCALLLNAVHLPLVAFQKNMVTITCILIHFATVLRPTSTFCYARRFQLCLHIPCDCIQKTSKSCHRSVKCLAVHLLRPA